MKVIVSIITLTYNHELFITQCIESVLNQTFKDWEMIIIDDCSSDKTGDIITKYLTDKRIKYIRHEKNYGKDKLAITHNEALAISNGELITILEGDDYWPEYRLEKQIEQFEKDDIVLCHGNIAFIKEDQIIPSQDFKNIPLEILKNNPVGSALKYFLYGKIPVLAQSAIVKKEILNNIGGFKQYPSFLYLVDYPTWMEISLYGKFAFIPEILGYWRRHSYSITSLHEDILWQGIINCIDQFVIEKVEVIEKLSVRLKNYIEYSGGYAWINLYKNSILKKQKKKWKIYFYEIWKRKKGCAKKDIIKVLLLSLSIFIPLLSNLYGYYIKRRTKNFSPKINYG